MLVIGSWYSSVGLLSAVVKSVLFFPFFFLFHFVHSKCNDTEVHSFVIDHIIQSCRLILNGVTNYKFVEEICGILYSIIKHNFCIKKKTYFPPVL